MIDLLKKQALNDRLPKYLDSDIEVAHKTGELFGAKHDAGIVYAKTGDYVIVVLSDTKDYDKAAENIARYSEEIYNYFNSIQLIN
jgi:beta-lactamase class A